MAVKIRLKRAGSKKRPFYRVVVTDSRKARDSRSIEDIGYYNPLESPAVVNVDREKVDFWIGRGAQFTDTVKTILRAENSVQRTRREIPPFSPEAVQVKKPKQSEKGEKGAKAKPKAAPKPAPKAKAPAPAAAEPAPAAKPAEPAPAAKPAEPAPAAKPAPAVAEAPTEVAAEAPAEMTPAETVAEAPAPEAGGDAETKEKPAGDA